MKSEAVLALLSLALLITGVAGGDALRESLTGSSATTKTAVATRASSETSRADSAEFRGEHPAPTSDLLNPVNDKIGELPADDSSRTEVIKYAGFVSASEFSSVGANVPAEQEHDARQPLENQGQQASGVISDAFRKTRELLIRQHFPDASRDEIIVWVEEFADFDDSELHFLLEQRQRAGAVRPGQAVPFPNDLSTSGPSVLADNTSAVDLELSAGTPPTWLQTAIELTTANLRNADVPGYRAQRVLLTPLAVEAAKSASPDTSPTLSIRQFDAGRIVTSLNPLHVALPDDPGLMFRMEPNDVLTRCGQFSIVSGRRLGLRIGDRELLVPGVLTIPEDAMRIGIDESGNVLWNRADGTEQKAGHLSVVRLDHRNCPVTEDGICFHASDAAILSETDTTTLQLRTRCFEMSNVTLSDEWERLDHFRRLDKELRSRAE